MLIQIINIFWIKYLEGMKDGFQGAILKKEFKCGLASLFDGMSTFIGYFMPKPFL